MPRAPRTHSTRTDDTEWVGGVFAMPAYVTGEGEPYRPEVLVWMRDGAIVGSTVGRPGEAVAQACDSLQAALDAPLIGRPHAPARIRVASAELAEVIRTGHPAIEVVCAATPEIDDMVAAMRAKMEEDGEGEHSYLGPGIEPARLAAWFEAVAALYRIGPWTIVPDDGCLFSVTIEQLGLYDGVMSIVGQMGQSFGLLLFASFEDFEVFADASLAVDAGEQPSIPPHLALCFEPLAELPGGLEREIAEHGWEVAGPNAYPLMIAVDDDLVSRPPTAGEITMTEAIARALVHVLAEKRAVAEAWDGGEAIERTYAVATGQGELEVTLVAPHDGGSFADEELDWDEEELNQRGREIIDDDMALQFAESPEAKHLDEIHACRLLMDLAYHYLGATVATLDAEGLDEVVFEVIPRQVSMDSSAAAGIIEELRAFYRFLKRELDIPQADACLGVLGPSSVARLESAMADPRNFGIAKSMMMAGRDAGYDIESTEGVEAWMRALEVQRVPQSIGKANNKAKKKRKVARKARKRNR